MNKSLDQLHKLVAANVRVLAAVIVVMMGLNVVTVVRRTSDTLPAGAPGAKAAGSLNDNAGAAGTSAAPGAPKLGKAGGPGAPGVGPETNPFIGNPGEFIPGKGTVPRFGIYGNKIRIVYYWAGDRTGNSKYLGAAGQSGAVDEADAFRRFVTYINKHRNGGTFMGVPFNLHGLELEVDEENILDAGKYGEGYNVTAQKIIDRKPFAAVSSHGGLSSFICPELARAHIFNPVTYNLNWDLISEHDGWCLPQGLSFEKQVGLTIPYLQRWVKTPYDTAGVATPRKFGILYAGYPGTEKAVPRLRKMLLEAGLPLSARDYPVPVGLTDAGQAAPGVIGKMQSDGVNTVIAPDSGSLITFTRAAPGRGFTPDYYVWPCSGADAAGQVRLYDATEWSRAQGLSCYDDNWNLDLTLDDNARQTQWFKQYREIAGGNQDPPATTPLVYQGMFPVLAALTDAGSPLTYESFFSGLHHRRPYRYNAINGPTTDASHFLISVGAPDGSQIGDVAEVKWSNTTTTAGNATAGAYIYSTRRYQAGWVFT